MTISSARTAVSSAIAIAAIAASASLTLCLPAQSPASGDQTLQQRIAHRFETSPSLKNQDIEVIVENGVATLTGVVPTSTLKARAGQLARISGITRVDNQIDVDAAKSSRSKIDAAGAKTKEGVDKGVDATVNAARKTKDAVEKGIAKSEAGAGKAADKSAEGLSKAGEKLTDAAVATRIKSGFDGDETVRGNAIDVSVTDHVVRLRGTVPSTAVRERAVAIAKGTDGVRGVVDELVVSRH